MPSDALQALYEGDREKAHGLLGPDDELTVFDAAAFGRGERLRALLAEDPSLARAFSDDGFTALHLAVFGEQEEAARIVIDAGADLDARSTGAIARVPPLGTAAFVGSVPLARLLLDAGADVNAQEEGGATALDAATANGNEPLARLLRDRGGQSGGGQSGGGQSGSLGGA